MRVGYDRATTTMVAKLAGVSVGSLYQYFPNKDAVFSRLLKHELDQLLAGMTAAAAGAAGAGFRAQVSAVIEALLRRKSENPRLHRVLKTELGRLDGARIIQRLNQRSLALIESLLLQHVRELPAPDARRVAFLVVNAVEGIVGATLLDAPASLGDPALVRELTAIVLALLGALPPPTE